MRNNRIWMTSLMALSMTVAGCAEVQRAAEDVARQSGPLLASGCSRRTSSV